VLAETVLKSRGGGRSRFPLRDFTSLDYGIDGQIEVVETIGEREEPTSKIVSVQVQSGSSFRRSATAGWCA